MDSRPKRGTASPQLEGPHQIMGINHPNSRGHQSMRVHHAKSQGPTEAWESFTPTPGSTPKSVSPSPQIEGPHRGVGPRVGVIDYHALVWSLELG